jgi:hypothetical protein
MQLEGFEPAIPGSHRPQTNAINRTATEWACSLLLYVFQLMFTVLSLKLGHGCGVETLIIKNQIIIIIIIIGTTGTVTKSLTEKL